MLHALTGVWVFPDLADIPKHLGQIGLPLAWFFDALAAAILIKAGILTLNAIGLPAMKGHMMKADFIASMSKD